MHCAAVLSSVSLGIPSLVPCISCLIRSEMHGFSWLPVISTQMKDTSYLPFLPGVVLTNGAMMSRVKIQLLPCLTLPLRPSRSSFYTWYPSFRAFPLCVGAPVIPPSVFMMVLTLSCYIIRSLRGLTLVPHVSCLDLCSCVTCWVLHPSSFVSISNNLPLV